MTTQELRDLADRHGLTIDAGTTGAGGADGYFHDLVAFVPHGRPWAGAYCFAEDVIAWANGPHPATWEMVTNVGHPEYGRPYLCLPSFWVPAGDLETLCRPAEGVKRWRAFCPYAKLVGSKGRWVPCTDHVWAADEETARRHFGKLYMAGAEVTCTEEPLP